jgi:hypothetical protein
VGAGRQAGGGVPDAWARSVGGRAAAWGVAGRVAKREGKEKREEGRGRRYTYLLCRVPAIWHSTKIFLKFKNKLCRVPDRGHSAKICSRVFAECQCTGTRQRCFCRVLAVQTLDKALF